MKTLNPQLWKSDFLEDKQMKPGGRYLPVFHVFSDISISTTQTNEHNPCISIWYYTDDASKVLDITSWVHIIFTRIRGGPASLAAFRQPRSPRLSKCWWVEDGGEDTVRKMTTAESGIFTPQALLSLPHEEFFPPALFPSLNICGPSYVPGSVQSSMDKGEVLLSWGLEPTGWGRSKASSHKRERIEADFSAEEEGWEARGKAEY